MGTTSDFLKLRSTAATVKVNEWHNNFTLCKDFAEKNNLPFFAVWTNGDACGLCVSFEKLLMLAKFKEWMAKQNCVFWFGCSKDTSKEDKAQGTGYTWCWKNKTLKYYPFVRIYQKNKFDKAISGKDLSGGNVSKFIANIEAIMCPDCKPKQDTYKPPVLTIKKVKTNSYKLLVNGKAPTALTEKDANYILEKYNK